MIDLEANFSDGKYERVKIEVVSKPKKPTFLPTFTVKEIRDYADAMEAYEKDYELWKEYNLKETASYNEAYRIFWNDVRLIFPEMDDDRFGRLQAHVQEKTDGSFVSMIALIEELEWIFGD